METREVLIHDVTPHLSSFDTPGSTITAQQNKPVHTIRSHKRSEGYAADRSKLSTTGKLATGDVDGKIFTHTRADNGSWTSDSQSFTGHTGSVEEIQWSPTEKTVFASASSDHTVKVWDTWLNKQKPAVSVQVADADVNVLSWSNQTAHLLASGHDDGSWVVWDLRQWKPQKGQTDAKPSPVASFNIHKEQITSLEWHPTDDGIILAASGDNTLTLWDLAVELDDEESQETTGVQECPPQLLFVHWMEQAKEGHWHPQIPGAVMATGGSGFGNPVVGLVQLPISLKHFYIIQSLLYIYSHTASNVPCQSLHAAVELLSIICCPRSYFDLRRFIHNARDLPWARDGKWEIEDVTLRPIGDEELVVQIVASGICHTDLVVGDQPDGAAPFVFYPRVLGHEARRPAYSPPPSTKRHKSLTAILREQRARELEREEEEEALAAEALAAGLRGGSEEDEGGEGGDGSAGDSQLAEDFYDEQGFTDEDVNNMDNDEVNIEEESFATQPTQQLTHVPHFVTTREQLMVETSDQIDAAATALLGAGSSIADEDRTLQMETRSRAKRSNIAASTAPAKLSVKKPKSTQTKRVKQAKESTRKSLGKRQQQKERERPIKLKVNMGSKAKSAHKVSKPAKRAATLPRAPNKSPARSESPSIPSSPPMPLPPPPVRFQTTWRVQVEGEEKDIWCNSTVESSRTLKLVTAYQTVQSCKQSIHRDYVDNYQLIKLTATSTKEKGKDKPEVASMMCTSYSEFDKVYNLMETVRYWASAGNVVIKLDCLVRLRIEPEAPTQSSAISSETALGALGGLTIEQLSTFLGGLVQQQPQLQPQPGASKPSRKSATQQQWLNLPGSTLVEAIAGNPGPLIVSRWICEVPTCAYYGNSCYSLAGSNRELSSTHYYLNGDVIRLWAQAIKASKDGGITAEASPPAVLLKLGLNSGGGVLGGGSRSRDAAQYAAPTGLGTPQPYPTYPPPAYPQPYTPQPPHPNPYPGYGSLPHAPTMQPVEAPAPSTLRNPTSSPIRDEEETGESMRKFFDYLAARPDYVSCRDLLLQVQSDLLSDYFDLQGLKTDVTASWWSDHSFPIGLLPRIRRALADYRKRSKTP
ncbi:hypothetical protein LTS18_008717 [Coniosporium uncinatum]|uniref:Uncharacterized protein n=1 Tax=Coniosporium uncinatum TaxID=93489 RepID=A0ACC3DZH0_9PEZI|nr:hypothetical protein LTS18_008717 [Coniosporium uncinatum]